MTFKDVLAEFGWKHSRERNHEPIYDAGVREMAEEILKLREHKKLLFNENSRLLQEKESGLWDANHPVRKELKAALEMKLVLENAIKKSIAIADDNADSGISAPIRKAVRQIKVTCGTYGCQKLKDKGAIFCPSCLEDYKDDPDAYK